MNNKRGCLFDAESHTYTINGRIVPSVTQVLRSVVPGFEADEWYLQRGRAVHAACAMVCRGQAMAALDERIAGQVAACKAWLADSQSAVIDVECQVFEVLYQYAGTYDALVSQPRGRLLVDWKHSIDAGLPFQLAAYSRCVPGVKYGVGVALHTDGTYAQTPIIDLRPRLNEFLAMRSVWGVWKRLGKLQQKEGNGK